MKILGVCGSLQSGSGNRALLDAGELEGKVVGITAAVNIEGRGRRGLEAQVFAQGFATAKMHWIVENVFEDGEVKRGVIVFQRWYPPC